MTNIKEMCRHEWDFRTCYVLSEFFLWSLSLFNLNIKLDFLWSHLEETQMRKWCRLQRSSQGLPMIIQRLQNGEKHYVLWNSNSDSDYCTMLKFHIGSDLDYDPLIEMYVVGTEICPWDRDLSLKWVQ